MPRVAAPSDVREAILDAAMRLMEWHGYRKMTMDDIAQEAQIGKATIYGYFNSKEDVALSVVDRKRKVILEQCRAILAADAPPEARLRQMVAGIVLSGFDSACRYRQSLDETLASLRAVVLSRRDEWNAELAQLLAVVIQEGCDQGVFACDNADSAAQTLITCVSGLSPTNLSPRELGSREEIAIRAQQVIDLVLTGLNTRL